MSVEILIASTVVVLALAVASGSLVSWALSTSSPGRRRLRELEPGLPSGTLAGATLTTGLNPTLRRLSAAIPVRSPKEMTRVQQRLATAGYRSVSVAIVYVLGELLLPLIFAAVPLLWLGVTRGWVPAVILGFLGWMLPGFWLSRRITARKKQLRNALPDALDLLVVCLESGSSVDQAIVKVSDELEVAYPVLAEEFRLITAETRAGKPRLEAFKNFADRTKVEDIRTLVATLVQTDRFGTSMGRALRTHAETSRTKRRQRAEEHAAKLGVKLVFPLVLCLFPAFYVVVLGPVVIKFVRVFYGQVINP